MRQGLGLIGIVLAVESFLVGAEDLGEADRVTTEVVDEHVVGLTLLADGPIVVLDAAQDVNVALALEQMVVVSATEAAPAVAMPLHALPELEGRNEGKEKGDKPNEAGWSHVRLNIVRNFKEYDSKVTEGT